MRIRYGLTLAMTAAVVAALGSAGNAASSKTLYLSQTGTDCQSPVWEIVADADDTSECSTIPRILVDGSGVDNVAEAFSGRKLAVALNGKGRITGKFAITAPPPVTSDSTPRDALGVVAANFTIKINKTKIGVVHLDGQVAPTGSVAKTFDFAVPKALAQTTSVSISVSVDWISCVGVAGCAVRVSGTDIHSRIVLPTR